MSVKFDFIQLSENSLVETITKIGNALDRAVSMAIEEGDVKGLAMVTRVYADMSGANAPKKHEVTGAERDRLWNLAKAFIPSYAEYDRLAGERTIPVLAFTEID